MPDNILTADSLRCVASSNTTHKVIGYEKAQKNIDTRCHTLAFDAVSAAYRKVLQKAMPAMLMHSPRKIVVVLVPPPRINGSNPSMM
jgi:hypothetical protein